MPIDDMLADGSVRCPICLAEFAWDDAPFVQQNAEDGTHQVLLRRNGQSERAWAFELEERDARRMCLGDHPNIPPHSLPRRYGEFDAPIVIGFVGGTNAGKSHLLASMVGEIMRGGLGPLDLEAAPLDPAIHREYTAEFVRPLFEDRRKIQNTAVVRETRFTDGFILRNISTGRSRVLALFDVAGESLKKAGDSNRFFGAVTGLVFVVDPQRIPELATNGTARSSELGDETFESAVGILSRTAENLGHQGAFLDLPIALVVAKSDTIEQHQAVRRFYRGHGLADGLSAELIDEETREAYAFLYQYRAKAWLAPVSAFLYASIHFASATGFGLQDADTFRSVNPVRVLEPLGAILAREGLCQAGGRWEIRAGRGVGR